ncbi:MAG TPA: tetratricopeptide repeat protein [Rhizobacter sp.]|nr:tetratricopeptide repeat protein [Rhizobacter sp.]
MQLLDRDIGNCRALVVDANPTSRSILASQLRDFGVGTVSQCSRIEDARRQLEARPFDVVLCEHQFVGADYSAQNLLDDLRRNQLLPLSTVFIIVTGEASYTMVAEAAESALDSYLLKPHTATALGERLMQARNRKRALNGIFTAIESQDFDEAARLCVARFEARQAYWLYAARIGSELLLRQGNHVAGRALYEAVLKTGALPWAKLGIARAQIEANQPTQALRTLESLLCDHPTHVDAYDVMGRVQMEQGNLGEALDTYRKASALTPGSITRLQKHGMLAFYMGDRDESAKMLERAAAIGISSKMFDMQTLVVLAFSRFHQRDTKGLQRCHDNLLHALEKAPKSRRLQRFAAVVNVFNLMLRKQVAAVVAEVRQMFTDLREPSLDVEAACNLMTLLAQLTAAELRLDGAEDWIDALAMRFVSSKALTELLAASVSFHPPFAQRVHDAQACIAEMAEQAVTNSLRGDHRLAVKSLITRGEQTLNAKLIDMARMTLQRHHAKISDAQALSDMVEEMRRRYAAGVSMPTLGQTKGRQAGALSLREAAVTEQPDGDGAADQEQAA